ncbi:hypothetical protein CKO15_01160 [Halorhodospira abdelmalekii]|uniref:DUF945 family protein n=1 Tax=Halorhodospira abdelmalekii TaxID=421629 RepID=UPI001908BA4A|nr:DUF945 family protein [Halorhodospira abdelmalekii]MBK1733909.1 hypothetical protein [Halorhodospira abdelmalekii]
MKKAVVGVGVALLFGLLLLTLVGGYGVGGGLEQRLSSAVAEFDAESDQVTVEVVEFDRGHWSSQAQLRIALSGEVAAEYRREVGAPFAFEVPLTIEHGPLLWEATGPRFAWARASGDVRLTPGTVAGVEQASGEVMQWRVPLDGSPAELELRFGLGGQLDGRLTLRDFSGTVVEADGERLALTLADVELRHRSEAAGERFFTTVRGAELGYALGAAGGERQGASDRGQLRDFVLSITGEAHPSGLWPGGLELSAAEWSLHSGGLGHDGARGGLPALGWQGEEVALRYSLELAQERATLGVAADSGPLRWWLDREEVRLAAAQLRATLSEVTAESLLSANRLLQESDGLTAYQRDRLAQAAISEFINGGPRLQVDTLRLVGEHGAGELSGRLQLTERSNRVLNPWAILEGADLDVTLRIDERQLFALLGAMGAAVEDTTGLGGESGVELGIGQPDQPGAELGIEADEARTQPVARPGGQWQQIIEEAVAAGYIERQDGVLSSRLRFSDARLRINDQPAEELVLALWAAFL